MKVNNKSYRGIFLYSDDATYERGDFVVEGKFLYTCKTDGISGSKPSQDTENYMIYFGGEFAEYEDYLSYAEKGSSEAAEKFVSTPLLEKILNSYMAGYSEYGLIDNRISADGEIFMADFFGSGYDISSEVKYSDPLRVIMSQSNINNAVFVVSRKVTLSILGEPGQSDTNDVLLKQYTYKDASTGNNIRIQELIDQEYGIVKYRYLIIPGGTDFTGNISTWISTCTNENVRNMVDTIISTYDALKAKKISDIINVRNTFRFVNLPFSSESGIYKFLKPDSSDGIVTLCLRRVESSARSGVFYRTDSISIPLGDITTSKTYKIFSEIDMIISKVGSYYTVSFNLGGLLGSVEVYQVYVHNYYTDDYEID
jgi:hypothetical protein